MISTCVGKKCCPLNEPPFNGGVWGATVWYVNEGAIVVAGSVGDGTYGGVE